MKIAYNRCFGGFSLSRAAILRAREISGDPHWNGASIIGDTFEDSGKPVTSDYGSLDDNIKRHDPILIQVIEELGKEANGYLAALAIADIPKGARYRIDEYDGQESVMTPSDYDWEIAQ